MKKRVTLVITNQMQMDIVVKEGSLKMKLNLGCGEDKKEGYINCDIRKEVKPDRIIDLIKELPFEESSINEIYMRHVLEHIPNYDFLMKEMWRVCERNAKIIILVPFYSSYCMFSSPEHINFFTPETFNKYENLFNVKSRINFFRKGSKFLDKIINYKQYFYCRFFAWTFPASQMSYELNVLK